MLEQSVADSTKQADALKKKISEILSDDIAVNMLFVLKQETGLEYWWANFKEDNSTALAELNASFVDEVKSCILEIGDLKLRPLSDYDDDKSSLYWLDYETLPEKLEQLCNVLKLDHESFEQHKNFKLNQENLSKLFGYVIYIGTAEKHFALFKKHSPLNLLHKGFLFGLLHDYSRFTVTPASGTLHLSTSFNMLMLNDQLYTFDLGMLERNFGLDEVLKTQAKQAIDFISSLGLVEDAEVVTDLLEEPGLVRKLAKAAQHSPVIKQGITKNQILDFIRETPDLNKSFLKGQNTDKISLATKKNKALFVKLLNDDILNSKLTGEVYNANSKERLAPTL